MLSRGCGHTHTTPHHPPASLACFTGGWGAGGGLGYLMTTSLGGPCLLHWGVGGGGGGGGPGVPHDYFTGGPMPASQGGLRYPHACFTWRPGVPHDCFTGGPGVPHAMHHPFIALFNSWKDIPYMSPLQIFVTHSSLPPHSLLTPHSSLLTPSSLPPHSLLTPSCHRESN